MRSRLNGSNEVKNEERKEAEFHERGVGREAAASLPDGQVVIKWSATSLARVAASTVNPAHHNSLMLPLTQMQPMHGVMYRMQCNDLVLLTYHLLLMPARTVAG